jgi:hypothetical protein
MAPFRGRLPAAVVIASMIAIYAQPSSHADDDLFAKYPVKATFHGPLAAPVLSDPDARSFRTKIRQGAARGPVFADHYAIAVWGCGAPCLRFAIIDSISGRVYIFPYNVSLLREVGEPLTHRRDSKAIHVIGSLEGENSKEDSADRWYLWDGKQLNLIQEKPAKLVDDPDPQQ